MEPAAAAKVLRQALPAQARDFTIADAAAKSGLPLRDAEAGLHALLAEYRGHLRVTSEGELLFRFPNGFTKPWQTRERFEVILGRLGAGLLGVARLLVRAWISIVLIGYVLIFMALLLGLAFARSNNDSRSSRDGAGLELGSLFFRMVFDALFWTFHPFSPFAYVDHSGSSFVQAAPRARRDETPFYEKVNRFFFGPTIPAPDARAQERRILAEIRAQRGRVGLADVIRVTGLPRDQADPLMSRLMLDYDGEVEVSSDGGIYYRFESLRKTVDAPSTAVAQPPIWARLKRLAPLTGNMFGANLLIAALNGFNLIMSVYALGNGLTLAKLVWIFNVMQHGMRYAGPEPTGFAVALGVVPLVFSIALFAIPLVRAAVRPLKQRRIAHENGRRGLLREILTNVRTGEITEESLTHAWKSAAGVEPDPKAITREVVALGGDIDLDGDKVRYRFPDLEGEAKALEAEREAASEGEARVGQVIFSSEN